MMLKVFDGNKMLKGARNWCLVQERHLVPGSAANDGALLFQVSGMWGGKCALLVQARARLRC